jgi:hypothetical protein
MLCEPKILKNEIFSNKEYGLLIGGLNNIALIEDNRLIAYNKMAGIKVENYAHPRIIKNIIFKNIF